MPIDLDFETSYYLEKLTKFTQIHAALQREDVQQALHLCPDADTLIADMKPQGLVITAFVNLEQDLAIAEIANGCDGKAYTLDTAQPLLEVPGVVTVQVNINGRWPLDDGERAVLRGIGKLQTEVSTREYLACAA